MAGNVGQDNHTSVNLSFRCIEPWADCFNSSTYVKMNDKCSWIFGWGVTLLSEIPIWDKNENCIDI